MAGPTCQMPYESIRKASQELRVKAPCQLRRVDFLTTVANNLLSNSPVTASFASSLQYSAMKAELKIAYEGDNAKNVALEFVDNLVLMVPYKCIEDACAAVKSQEVDFAVLPIETSTSGSIYTNYDLMLQYCLHVVGEYDQEELLTPEQHPGHISHTRYLLLSKKGDITLNKQNSGLPFKTLLVFSLKDSTIKGMLTRALEIFSRYNLDLIKIETRPWDGRKSNRTSKSILETGIYQYLFYVDVKGHLTDCHLSKAMYRLSKLCAFMRILGSYAISSSKTSATAVSSLVLANTNRSMADKYPLNPIFQKVTVAKTMLIHGHTKQMEAEGKKVWSLCVGEPDYNPHDRVLAAGAKAMNEGNIKYTHMKGLVELRDLISTYLQKAKGITFDPATEILVSNGAQQSVYQALYTVCRPGQKVIIPTPYWLNYPEIVKLVYAEPVPLRTTIEENYLINPKKLEKTLTMHPDTKAIILCNPNNPSGTLHSPEHLERIAAVLRKPQFCHVVVISDEIYEQLLYQDEGVPERKHVSFAALPGMFERTLLVNGFSKAHAMTGLRVGYLAAPKHFIDPCTILQAQVTSCPNTVGQIAAVEALKYELECMTNGKRRITEVMKTLDIKRRYIIKRLTAMHNVRFAYPTSAFYVFLDLSSYFKGKQITTSGSSVIFTSVDDFCAHLLHESNIAVVPGSEFGDEYGLRISYASSMEAIKHAMNGFENLLGLMTLKQ
ncbi:hypothetical protein CCR75_006206 [Bremia lactucae]|uniref:Prephenate dehydratase n=1 Tax=Bremia lactucae TaxID=4779 RepID=A0A976FI03_BRELC|nr:hypothetical protein CCR75_006206 [Bremia lactucae]